jgi:hypothetical protein
MLLSFPQDSGNIQAIVGVLTPDRQIAPVACNFYSINYVIRKTGEVWPGCGVGA